MTGPETGGGGAFRHFLDLGDAGGDAIAAMINDAIIAYEKGFYEEALDIQVVADGGLHAIDAASGARRWRFGSGRAPTPADRWTPVAPRNWPYLQPRAAVSCGSNRAVTFIA